MNSYITSALAVAMTLILPAGPAEAGDFTFKRVRPPTSETTRRIDIQIEPKAPRPAEPQGPDVADADTAPSEPGDRSEHQAWFWSAVSPSIAEKAGRFRKAAQVAARPPRGSGIAPPSLTHMQTIAKLHGPAILRHSVGTRVSPALILALISVESAGRTDALSHKGAQGLMQLIPATAARFGVSDSHDPGQNIRGGVAYLNWLMSEFGDDPVLALAGYNAGEGAVRKHDGVPPYSETRAYVPKVLAAWNVARLICTVPPTMPGDGCVFDASLVDS